MAGGAGCGGRGVARVTLRCPLPEGVAGKGG